MSKRITKAIVPAAGLGTRLLPATKSQPEEMLPVGRKPVVQYVVEELQGSGLTQILIITGRRKRAIEDHFDEDPQLMIALQEAGSEALLRELSFEGKSRLFYTRQSNPRGLGHAVSLGADFVDGQDCVVALGDSLIGADDPSTPVRAMIRAFRDLDAAAMVAVEQVPEQETFRYGIVSTEGNAPGESLGAGEPLPMTDIVEKPPLGTAPSRLAVAARYVFSPAIFDALDRTLPDRRGEIQLSDAIRLLIQKGERVYAWLLSPDQPRYDIGNFESYFRAFVEFALDDGHAGVALKKHLHRILREPAGDP